MKDIPLQDAYKILEDASAIIIDDDNQEVVIEGSSMFLMDTDAEDDTDAIQITILTTKELE